MLNRPVTKIVDQHLHKQHQSAKSAIIAQYYYVRSTTRFPCYRVEFCI